MAQLHEDISGVAYIEQKEAQEKDYWLSEFLPPNVVAEELKNFIDRPIPEELAIYKGLKPNVVLFELFVINGTPYKEALRKSIWEANKPQREALAKEVFDKDKSRGKIPLDKVFEFKETYKDSSVNIIDQSGQGTNEWFSLPLARIVAIGETSSEYNPLGIKVGDVVRLPDYWTWKAENPAYAHYINENPYKDAVGVKQATKPPMPWIYNAFAGNSGLARDAFNLNPLNYKNHGFIYKKMVTELEGLIDTKELIKYTEL